MRQPRAKVLHVLPSPSAPETSPSQSGRCLRSTPQREISPLSLQPRASARGEALPSISQIESLEGAENAEITSTLLHAITRTSPSNKRVAASPGGSSRGRLGPRAVDFKSPPRAVFASSAAARQARMDAHERVLHLSDAAASAPHVARLGEEDECDAARSAACALRLVQSYEPTGPVQSFEPIPVRRRSASACSNTSPGNASRLVGVASVRAASRPSSQSSSSSSMVGIAFMRGVSHSSLSLPTVGCSSGGSVSCWRGNVDTPPSAALAFEAAEALRLCRAPKAMRVRCETPREGRALSTSVLTLPEDAPAGGAVDEAMGDAASALDVERMPTMAMLTATSPRFRPVQVGDDISSVDSIEWLVS